MSDILAFVLAVCFVLFMDWMGDFRGINRIQSFVSTFWHVVITENVARFVEYWRSLPSREDYEREVFAPIFKQDDAPFNGEIGYFEQLRRMHLQKEVDYLRLKLDSNRSVTTQHWLVDETYARLKLEWQSASDREEEELEAEWEQELRLLASAVRSDEYTNDLRMIDNSARTVYVPSDLSEASDSAVVDPNELPEHWAIGDDGEIVDLGAKR